MNLNEFMKAEVGKQDLISLFLRFLKKLKNLHGPDDLQEMSDGSSDRIMDFISNETHNESPLNIYAEAKYAQVKIHHNHSIGVGALLFSLIAILLCQSSLNAIFVFIIYSLYMGGFVKFYALLEKKLLIDEIVSLASIKLDKEGN